MVDSNGIKHGLEIIGGSEEVAITYNFSRHFSITFSREDNFKSTKYIFSFLKPTKSIRERFNLSNEVLLLFSPYSEFEKRTMDFVDKTMQTYSNRIDKVCIFLVSRDLSIETKIKQILSENSEARIVIPFTYSEIMQNGLTQEQLNTKLNQYFYNRDLFELSSPLRSDQNFFGRSQIVQAFYDKYSIGEQSGLFGLRKIGKTSVLFALERLIELRSGVSIYIDCQSPSVNKRQWFELLYFIVRSLCEKYQLAFTPDIDNYSEKNAAQQFEVDLERTKTLLGNMRILLIFDEIEQIGFNTSSSQSWANGTDFIDFWKTIRSIYQMNDSLLSFIIAGVNPFCIEEALFGKFDNPIFGMLKPTYLNLFSYEDVRDMISNIGNYMGLRFENEIFSMLTDDYGGHPFLIRHICSLLNKDVTEPRPCRIEKYLYKHNKESYDDSMTNYIEQILGNLNNWYPSEYSLLETLVVDKESEFLKHLDYNEKIINHLIGYGIVKKVSGHYFVTINAVSEYIKKKKKYKSTPDSIEEKWFEVVERRNRIEIALRSLIKNIINNSYGFASLKTKLLEAVPNERKDKLDCYRGTEILSKMFLLELKNVVSKNWTDFDRTFQDKGKFELYLGIINEHRIDAHAKDISEEELALLRYSLRWFENILVNS